MEISFKCYYSFPEYFKSSWNLFDVAIVVSALAGPNFTFLSNIRTLRILRVLRTLRTLNGASRFQGLEIVIDTILDSAFGK